MDKDRNLEEFHEILEEVRDEIKGLRNQFNEFLGGIRKIEKKFDEIDLKSTIIAMIAISVSLAIAAISVGIQIMREKEPTLIIILAVSNIILISLSVYLIGKSLKYLSKLKNL